MRKHSSFFKHILTAAGVLLGLSLSAADGLSLSLQNYTVQNDSGNVPLGFTITINATLQNTDTTSFSGTINFGLRNSQQVLTSVGQLFGRPPYSGATIMLQPGETVPAVFSVHVEAPYFLPGPDVVVVWPISSRPVADSVLIPLQVNLPTAVRQEEEANFTYLITSERIVLNLPAQESVRQVRIYALSGQVVAAFNSGIANEIPINYLTHGIYLCEVITSLHKRKVIKFYHGY